jgi:hypothetical protein
MSIFFKLTIESKNIELFCIQLLCVLTFSHLFDVFYGAATINLDYNHL